MLRPLVSVCVVLALASAAVNDAHKDTRSDKTDKTDKTESLSASSDGSSSHSSNATPSRSSDTSRSLSPSTLPEFITVPLSIPSDDIYYNAYVTDDAGTSIGVRVDLVQPDLWFLNGAVLPNCSTLNSSASIGSAGCYVGDAFTPTTSAPSSSTYNIPYPNGISAQGSPYTANLTIGGVGGHLALDDFGFVLASSTNMHSGGLGLAPHPYASGLLDVLVSEGLVAGHGYSIYFGGKRNGTSGSLLLGAVDKSFYSGSLYQYPPVAYTGWDDNGDQRALPIVMLDKIILYNSVTRRQATLYGNESIPVLLDSRYGYSYLPLDTVIQLAVQTNAYYSSKSNRWIVKCSDIEDSHATVNLTFGPLNVPVPLTSLLVDAMMDNNYLYFSSGDRACFLNVLPNTRLGYTALGLPFITQMYLVMDNDGGHVGIANKNEDVDLDYDLDDDAKAFKGNASKLSVGNFSTNVSAQYIHSGTIPFATPVTYSENRTLTFAPSNITNTELIPSRFSAVIIQSGEIYITVPDSYTEKNSSSTPASTSKSDGMAIAYSSRNLSPIFWAILLAGLSLGICLS
ncbi:putative aspartic proteinase yapsin-7 [Clavispora lusitaniae]|uniref:Aspartic proteinase yapsin-7 n=1 Tax=Clavispora lusitaniae TaxID=36911 RepID=A0ACD0WI87_CLALS|nr:putative aspartic proteinase yapsin-7 [Clavispora lusitaniae]QFZ33435.1 putative aspartic proteinase yapsin-7 [Clavispora lusitaniae]QFZ39106.1 putative aspartic proteinase yapsin-7 [Clavispora lusitaniae]QFZ44788.1 putative aspartic proteinase yapsin-7 [Clavispora lusitaniae]QFZ50465.1 putative aspartic proteinase yapsin-7 [Clavispora lusitaniae]